MNVLEVHPDLARMAADLVGGFIAKAAENSVEDTTESLLAKVETGLAHFWIVHDDKPVGVCFWQIIPRPSDQVLGILALGGERGLQWADFIRERLKERARAEGASMLVTIGRKGWSRVYGLPPKGYYYEDRV